MNDLPKGVIMESMLILRKIVLSVFLTILPFCIVGQTTDPILTLNTSMHQSRIPRVSIDQSGKLILTCSDDKTAKLWDAASGTLIRTIRIPINEGDEGKLYACALSPDGLIGVVGGWTGYDSMGTYVIYLLDTTTGEIIDGISGFGSTIHDIEFSPDGRNIALALGNRGVRLFQTDPWVTLEPLTDYGDMVVNVAFDRNGRLATACLDGHIRLYNANYRQINDLLCTKGKKPVSLSFSPDGKKLAVGYLNSRVQVLDGYSLELLYEPKMPDAEKYSNKIAFVCYSRDGAYLYGGGSIQDDKLRNLIRQWRDDGSSDFIDYPIAKNTILDIKPMPDNGVVFCAYTPEFGRINSRGELLIKKTSEANDYNSEAKPLGRINNDGTQIGFTPYQLTGFSFDVSMRKLKEGESTGATFSDRAAKAIVTEWEQSTSPKINGRPTDFLGELNINYCVDVTDNGERIVFGAENGLYCLNYDGKLLWHSITQAAVWSCNVSGNGKVAIGALGNGLINWYRMTDGKLILSLFASSDNRRWILFTTSGYYDCVPGSEDLIGWHMNNGLSEKPSYYPASRFRSTYYRPDIIDNILVTLDEMEAVLLANDDAGREAVNFIIAESLPPTITIKNLHYGQEFTNPRIRMEYTVTSPKDNPVLSVKVLVDGRPFEWIKGLNNESSKNYIDIVLPKHDLKLAMVAENKFGFGVADEVSLKWSGSIQDSESVKKPSLYVLAVGVSTYNNPNIRLNFAAKDAIDFVGVLKSQPKELFETVKVRLLADSLATKQNIMDGLNWLQTNVTSNDVAVLFLSGHGYNDDADSFYYLTVAASSKDISGTCLSFQEIKDTVANVAGKFIVFVDACHAGNILGGKKRNIDINRIANELTSAENGAIVFTSSTGKQLSAESALWNNGAFTKAVVEGIHGQADLLNTGKIYVMSLNAYIAVRVKELTEENQTPTTIIPYGISDFPIASVNE